MQTATVLIPKRFVQAIVFMKTAYTVSCDQQYTMVVEAWNPALQAQHCQQPLAGASVSPPSLCQLPDSLSLNIDP